MKAGQNGGSAHVGVAVGSVASGVEGAEAEFLRHQQQHVAGAQYQVPSPQASWVGDKAEQPLEAPSLHP